jgi:NTE family protein
LFDGRRLAQIPRADTPGQPSFIFYATSLQTGRSVRLRQDHIADWKLGRCFGADISLAQAVAASSAFPPVFSPVIIKTDPDAWSGGEAGSTLKAMRQRLVLSDGVAQFGPGSLQQGRRLRAGQ